MRTINTDDAKDGINRVREVSRVFAHVLGGVTKIMDMAHEVIEDIESGHDIEYRHAQKKRRLQRQRHAERESEAQPIRREVKVQPKKTIVIDDDDDDDDLLSIDDLLEGTGLEPSAPPRRKPTQKPTSTIKSPKGLTKPQKKRS